MCVMSPNWFETTSRGGFGQPVQFGSTMQCGRDLTGQTRIFGAVQTSLNSLQNYCINIKEYTLFYNSTRQ